MRLTLQQLLLLMIICSFTHGSLLENLQEGMKFVSNVIDTAKHANKQTGECLFKCKNGLHKVADHSHTPSSNGCGSLGIDVDLSHIPKLTSCCDRHDYCYDKCGKERDECDSKFHDCLLNTCDRLNNKKKVKKHSFVTIDTCKLTANIIYESVTALGCNSYLKAQKKACMCVWKSRDEL